jgi:hypothetical protein
MKALSTAQAAHASLARLILRDTLSMKNQELQYQCRSSFLPKKIPSNKGFFAICKLIIKIA